MPQLDTDTPTLATLQLKKNADRRLRKGHLWIFSNEVDIQATPLKQFTAGEQVYVIGEHNKSIGVATINPNGLICGRLISRQAKQVLNKSLLVHRIKQALGLRQATFNAPFYRLVYGDSDLLPGLVVDRFGDYLVVQISTAGMEALKQDIVDALDQVLRPEGIVLRNDHSGRELEQLPSYVDSMGNVPDKVELIENDTRFLAPILTGQKTGWFYDHRMNRALLQKFCAGKRILDVFSYSGAWGIQAANAGASQVVCVDSSSQALTSVEENAALNDVSDKVSCIEGKALNVLKTLIGEGERFDIVVLDPPAFIKRRKDQRAGEAAYHHINELGMRLLGRDGMLVSASCSMHLQRDKLSELLRSASRKLDRHLQIIHQGGQGPDHPIHSAIAETEYLKAQFARVYLV